MQDPLRYHRWATPIWILLWLVLMAVALATRPHLPMDETRYLSVAWEMWRDGNFLVPHLNGEPYSHKPPLLFWTMHLGWAAFGVNDWTPRLAAPLFGLAALILSAGLARRLWPAVNDRPIAHLTPLVLLGSLFWTLFGTLTMFDMLLAACTLLALLGLLRVWRTGDRVGWLLVGIGIGLGILAKGPAILLHVLPVALLAPLWGPQLAGSESADRPSWRAWYGGLAGAVLLGVVIGLAWALPAAWVGGEAYAKAIFWGQSAGRVVDSFAHQEPWWLYLVTLPGLILPWTLWPPLWRGLLGGHRSFGDGGLRFCLAWLLPAVIVFSLISGKQLHYLLPEYPAIALVVVLLFRRGSERQSTRRYDMVVPATLFAVIGAALAVFALPFVPLPRGLTESAPAWDLLLLLTGASAIALRNVPIAVQAMTLTGLATIAVVCIHLTARPVLAEAYNLKPTAWAIHDLQAEGRPVAHFGKYHGQYQFLGRLSKPLDLVEGPEEVQSWIAAHPDGVVVFHQKRLPEGITPLFSQPFRLTVIALWNASTLAADPQILDLQR